MEVLVTGGTGFIGRHLCEALLEAGHGVVAVSRDPDRSVVPSEVEHRRGDVTEYDDLASVVTDVDAVVHLVALSPLYRPRGGETTHERIHVQGTRNLVRAMESRGIDRLVHMSALDADPDGPTAFLRAKGRAEGIVRSASLETTIIRPALVFGEGDEFRPFIKQVTTPYLTGLPGGGRMAFQPIWVGDLVAMLAEATVNARHIGETYALAGRQRYTLAELTKEVYAADGRAVKILPIPMPLARVGLTVAGPIPFVPFGSDQYRALRLNNTVEDNDVTAFDRTEETLLDVRTYLRERAPED